MGKGIGGFLKGIFVEETDEEFDEEFEEECGSQEDSSPKTNEVKPEKKAEPKKPEIKVDPKIVEAIKTAMEESNLDGYDYYEFMQSVSEQKDMPSEKRKYEVVFSVIKNMGITKEHLISTADHYLSVIDKHQEEFNAKIDSEEQEKVIKLKDKANGMEDTITEKTEQIEALKREIEELHNEKVEILEVAIKNEAAVTQYRQEGTLAYKLFKGQIKDGKDKINQYIAE